MSLWKLECTHVFFSIYGYCIAGVESNNNISSNLITFLATVIGVTNFIKIFKGNSGFEWEFPKYDKSSNTVSTPGSRADAW